MQSHIKIRLKFHCIIGLLEHERKQKQPIKLKIDAKADEFLDYAKVAKKAKKYLKKKKFKTIEKALQKLSKKLKKSYKQINKMQIEIYKTQILKNAKVGCSAKKRY